jgi:DNA-binding NarL/FixJ family response regulator
MPFKKNTTLVIADDHPMLLKGLYEELTSNKYNVVGQAANGLEALEFIMKLQPTIAILDIDMPFLTGLEVVKTVNEKGVKTKFIIQSFHKETAFIIQAKSLKISGYLLKEDSFLEMERCIKAVINNQDYFSSTLDNHFSINVADEMRRLKLLTNSELVILKLIAQRQSTNTIAAGLFVTPRTVEKHRSNIINKLDN